MKSCSFEHRLAKPSNISRINWNKSVKEEEELKAKKIKQENARAEIAEFLKKRQIEVEELKAQNQALETIVKSEDTNKDKVSWKGEFLGFDQQKHRTQRKWLHRRKECRSNEAGNLKTERIPEKT